MPRIRSIKPDFFRHHKLFLAEQESGLPLRLSFSGLWTCADKEGRFKWKPVELKLDILPYDEVDFENVLLSLAENGFIEKYEVDGKEYGCIPTFKDHQRITGSEATAESKIPCKPIDYKEGNTLETPKKQLGRQGREGKGKGREGKGRDSSEEVPTTFSLQKIYDKTWEEYSSGLNGQAKQLSEIIFIEWKKFVDFIWANDYHDLFKAKFVSPIDFGKLMTQQGFLQPKWKPVLEKMLSTGITPQQNLFFRIPQFMKYAEGTAGDKQPNLTTKHNAGALQLLAKGKQLYSDITGQKSD